MGSGIVAVEGDWGRTCGLSVRGTFGLIADRKLGGRERYRHVPAKSYAALERAVAVARSDDEMLYLAMHGEPTTRAPRGKRQMTRANLARALGGQGCVSGLYLASRHFGGKVAARDLLKGCTTLAWIAGYTRRIDWLESRASDLLFFNAALPDEPPENTAPGVKEVKKAARRLSQTVPSLVKRLGFNVDGRDKDGHPKPPL